MLTFEMYYLGFLIACVFSWKASAVSPPIERIITEYFNSQSVKSFKSAWDIHRRPMEHAIKTALAETVGLPGMNVYVRKLKDKITVGYLHDDNQVQVLLTDLKLHTMPRCRLPDVYFPLADNILKIESKLSEMIIQANYSLIRNPKHIIYETQDQDLNQNSPFLFAQVSETGSVAIRADDCTLSGFIIATLGGNSVNLGYDYFKLSGCVYTIEIYKPGSNSLPVIAKYKMDKDDDDGSLSLSELMLRPLLTEELLPKIQAAVFSFVNGSAIFGSMYTEYQDNQVIVFQATAEYMTDFAKLMNIISVNLKEGAIDMADHTLLTNNDNPKEKVQLTGMVLFGLNSMYSAHSGGPIKTDKVMIAEEIRFSSLQVRGTLKIISGGSEQSFVFASEIIDLVVDVHMEGQRWNKTTIKVKGLRRMSFSLAQLTHVSAEDVIGSYLVNAVTKLIHAHLKTTVPEAINPTKVSQEWSSDKYKKLNKNPTRKTSNK